MTFWLTCENGAQLQVMTWNVEQNKAKRGPANYILRVKPDVLFTQEDCCGGKEAAKTTAATLASELGGHYDCILRDLCGACVSSAVYQ